MMSWWDLAHAAMASADPVTFEFSIYVDAQHKQIMASLATRCVWRSPRARATSGPNDWLRAHHFLPTAPTPAAVKMSVVSILAQCEMTGMDTSAHSPWAANPTLLSGSAFPAQSPVQTEQTSNK